MPSSPQDLSPILSDSYDRPYSDDVEAQLSEEKDAEHVAPSTQDNVAAEYMVSTKVKLICLGIYFAMNLALTLYNKAVLGSFRFPWLLTAIHTSAASLGCLGMMACGWITPRKLTSSEHLGLLAFSFLFTINIAISNVSLALVSVPFHQIARSISPVATIALYRCIFGRTYSWSTYLSLVPVILGVGLSTYGDYYATLIGASLTFLGVVLAAIKTVTTNRLMTGSLALPALEVLLRLSPLAAVQSLFYAFLSGEAAAFAQFRAEGNFTTHLAIALIGNGVLAFCLNVSSFQTNKLAGALTITVCGNVKQCLTVLLGVMMFNVQIGLLNGLGMLVALAGAGWYSYVEVVAKSRK